MKKVLFLCIGNSCRSQMAEGFARCYGSDVMIPSSAGLSPASIVQPMTKTVMEQKGISLEGQYPKDLSEVDLRDLDMLVNMSGEKLPATLPLGTREWKIQDPIGRSEEVYIKVRDEIEMQVMLLILELRRRAKVVRPA